MIDIPTLVGGNFSFNSKDDIYRYFINLPPATFPKYNILYISETSIQIHIALAGFKKEDIRVMMSDEGQLLIAGCNTSSTSHRYLAKFISTRNFSIEFHLKPSVIKQNISFINGVLIIELQLNDFKQIGQMRYLQIQ